MTPNLKARVRRLEQARAEAAGVMGIATPRRGPRDRAEVSAFVSRIRACHSRAAVTYIANVGRWPL